MISVIVPVYNTEEYLHRCIDSILAQTYADFELILVDDGSTDNSGRICDEYAAADCRIVVLHQENKGQATARNVGLDYVFAKSDSEWICFVDSDDAVHSQMLELLYRSIADTGQKLIVGEFEEFKGDAVPQPETIDTKSSGLSCDQPEDFFAESRFLETVPWGKLYHKSCFAHVRYPDGKSFEDNFTTYKIIFAQDYILRLHHPIYYYYSNAGSVTKSGWNPKNLQAFEAYSEQIAFFEKNGYQKARNKSVYTYAAVLCWQIGRVKRLPQYERYLIRMRKMLRLHLQHYQDVQELSRERNPQFYQEAYPTASKLHHKVNTAKHVIRRLGITDNRTIKPLGKLYLQHKIRRNLRTRKPETEINYPIDFVVTWVDGNDPVWSEEKAKYLRASDTLTQKDNPEMRYRRWNTLRYWFRAVERFAPWTNQVILVTCGHLPEWLNTENEKLRIVRHTDYIPAEYLPTFSSHTIENNLWRIGELSEHFVYFNDDVFLMNEVKPSDFFCGEVPKHCAVSRPNRSGKQMCSFDHALINGLGEINSAFKMREVMDCYPEKWLNSRMKDYYEYNARTYRDNFLSGMYFSHLCVPLRKSSMRECSEKFADKLKETSRNRFRSYQDVNHQIFQLWEMVNGTFEPVERGYYGRYKALTAENLPLIAADMKNEKLKCICLNDSDEIKDDAFDGVKSCLLRLFEEKLPEKCSFEK